MDDRRVSGIEPVMVTVSHIFETSGNKGGVEGGRGGFPRIFSAKGAVVWWVWGR